MKRWPTRLRLRAERRMKVAGIEHKNLSEADGVDRLGRARDVSEGQARLERNGLGRSSTSWSARARVPVHVPRMRPRRVPMRARLPAPVGGGLGRRRTNRRPGRDRDGTAAGWQSSRPAPRCTRGTSSSPSTGPKSSRSDAAGGDQGSRGRRRDRLPGAARLRRTKAHSCGASVTATSERLRSPG